MEDAKGDERTPILKEIKRLEVSIAVASEQGKAMESQLRTMREEAEKFGRESVDTGMLRTDLKNLDAVQSQLVSEVEKLKVEINSAPRHGAANRGLVRGCM